MRSLVVGALKPAVPRLQGHGTAEDGFSEQMRFTSQELTHHTPGRKAQLPSSGVWLVVV